MTDSHRVTTSGGGVERADEDVVSWRAELSRPAAPAPSATVGGNDDTWAWAHENTEPSPPTLGVRQVAIVVVVHNGAPWLPRTFSSLKNLSGLPCVVVVDTGSTDESPGLIADEVVSGLVTSVVDAPGATRFGAAVAAAESVLDAEVSWLWLLHDDSEVTPEALVELRRAASDTPRPDLLFPKLLLPRRRNHPDQVLEIGQSITASGGRHLWTEPGDIDQHQQQPGRVLGGSTCGLFVRREALRDLGGFDPAVPAYRDGVDLGWRANDAGLRVVTCPAAAVRHHQAGRWGDRQSTWAERPHETDRLLGMRVVAARAALPAAATRSMRVAAVARAAGLVLGRAPELSAAELRAARRLRATADQTVALRSRLVHPSQQRDLRPRATAVFRRRVDRAADWVLDAARDWRDDPDTSLDDLIGDDFDGGRRSARWMRPGLVGLLAMVLFTIVAARATLWGAGSLTATELLPAPGSVGEAWRAALEPAPGHPGSNAPWLVWAALGSTLTLGRPEWFARLAVLGAPLWGYLSAAWVARSAIGRGWRPVVIGAAWAVVVVGDGLAGRGSLGGAALAALTPLVVHAVRQWWTADDDEVPAEAWRQPALAALLLGLIGSAYPVVSLAGPVLVAAWLVRARGWGVRPDIVHGPGLVLLAAGPALMSAPWWQRLASDPARLLTGSDPLAHPAGAAASFADVVMGRGSVPALPLAFSLIFALALWFAAGWVIVTGARVGDRGELPWLAVAMVAAGVVAAAWLARVTVTVGGQPVRPSIDAWLVCLHGGLLLIWASSLARRDDGREPSDLWRPAGIVVVVGVLAMVLCWVVGAATRPQVRDDSALPSYVTSIENSDRATRTLLVHRDNQTTRWNLVSSTRPQWGSGEIDIDERAAVQDLAAQVVSGRPSNDLASRLAALGIGHVWLRGGTADQVAGVSNAPGLQQVPADDTTVIWTVTGLPSRVTVDGSPVALGTVAGGTTLRLAEPADARWRVSVGGRRLAAAAAAGGYGPQFTVQGATGAVEVRLPRSVGALCWQLLAALTLVVFAAPSAGARSGTRGSPRRGRSA